MMRIKQQIDIVKRAAYHEKYFSPDGKFVYVPIPKNASSFSKSIFTHVDWERQLNKNIINEHSIVAIRDPMDRWISGMAEYIFKTGHAMDLLLDDDAFITYMLSNPVVDDHTDLQINFLKDIDIMNTTFIEMGSNPLNNIHLYNEKLMKFFSNNGIDIKFRATDAGNVSSDYPEKQKYIKKIRAVLKNPDHKAIFNNTYYPDVQFFKHLKDNNLIL